MKFLRNPSLGRRLTGAILTTAAIVGIAVGVKQLFFEGDDGPTLGRVTAPHAPRTTPTPPEPEGQIVFPASGESIPREIVARGTLSDIPVDEHVWLAVRDGNLLFPQASEIPASDGKWRLAFRQAGRTSAIGLELLLMGDEGHRFIQKRLEARDFSGIAKIPGSTRLDYVENLELE